MRFRFQSVAMLYLQVEWPSLTWILALLTIIGLVIVALIIIFSRIKEETHKSYKENADALEKLLKTRTEERDTANVKLAETTKALEVCEEELETVSAEYRTLVGINLSALFTYWGTREEEIARHDNRITEINRLGRRLKMYEDENPNGPKQLVSDTN